MTVIELKEKLIARIHDVNDVNMLQHWEEVMEIDMDEKVYILSSEERTMIEERTKEIEDGHWISGEEADRQIEEWLKK